MLNEQEIAKNYYRQAEQLMIANPSLSTYVKFKQLILKVAVELLDAYTDGAGGKGFLAVHPEYRIARTALVKKEL